MTYDSKLTAAFDDRVLAHLQVVIWAKIRRGERFAFTWVDGERNGYARTSIWIHPDVSLAFQYFGSKMPMLNVKWVEALTESANSSGGLQLVPEPS